MFTSTYFMFIGKATCIIPFRLSQCDAGDDVDDDDDGDVPHKHSTKMPSNEWRKC